MYLALGEAYYLYIIFTFTPFISMYHNFTQIIKI